MAMTFYCAPMSTASVTEAVLAELALPMERVTLSLSGGETRTPKFLALNPNGKVPTLVHDGVALWESCAITLYLAEMFGVERGLYPPPGVTRGQAMTWIAWASATLAPAAGRLAAALPATTPGAVEAGVAEAARAPRDSAAESAARAEIAALLGVLDGALAETPFLIGVYSLADTHLYPYTQWLAMMGVDLAPFDRVRAWMHRCAARPALRALDDAAAAQLDSDG